jgi:hypothetical protein
MTGHAKLPWSVSFLLLCLGLQTPPSRTTPGRGPSGPRLSSRDGCVLVPARAHYTSDGETGVRRILGVACSGGSWSVVARGGGAPVGMRAGPLPLRVVAGVSVGGAQAPS